MQVAWMVARYEECAGCVYDMMKVQEKGGGLAACAIVFSKPSCGKQAKLYKSAGTSKRLAPCKLHAKSLTIHENCEFLSHSHRCSGTHCLHMHKYFLLYQFRRVGIASRRSPLRRGALVEASPQQRLRRDPGNGGLAFSHSSVFSISSSFLLYTS